VVHGKFIDVIRSVAESTSTFSCFHEDSIGVCPTVKAELCRDNIAMVKTMQAWLLLSHEISPFPTIASSWPNEQTPGGVLFLSLALPLSVPSWHRYCTWCRVITANLPGSDLGMETLRKECGSQESYRDTINRFVDQSGCCSNLDEWPDELIIMLSLRHYSDGRLSHVQDAVSQITYQRTLLTTMDNYIGIGPRWVQPGDFIVFIPGLKVPVIVRQAQGVDRFRLIGPVCIHGVMMGERWTEHSLEKIMLI